MSQKAESILVDKFIIHKIKIPIVRVFHPSYVQRYGKRQEYEKQIQNLTHQTNQLTLGQQLIINTMDLSLNLKQTTLDVKVLQASSTIYNPKYYQLIYKNMKAENYLIGVWIVGVLSFICIWFYSFFAWGFLIGLILGWLPALIGGFLFGFLWPLVIIALIAMTFLLFV